MKPQPTNVKDLQYFLVMVKCLNKYLPRLADLGNNLREPIKKNVLFIWRPGYNEAFLAIRKEITSAPIFK